MRRALYVSIVAVASLAACPVSANDTAGNVQFLLGQRYLTDDAWKPIDSPSSFGIEIDFAPAESPVHVALGVLVSGQSGTATPANPYFGKFGGDIDNRFFEFSAGFLWHPVKKAIVRPYLGAGALLLTAADNTDFGVFSGNSDSDQSFGFYGNVGAFFKVGDSFNIGLDGRIVRGTRVTIQGLQTDADYEQINMLIGFSWGGSSSAPSQNGSTPR